MVKTKKPPATNEAEKHFLEGRHPEYSDNLNHWQFLRQAYEGGQTYFKDNLIRFVKEENEDYQERLDRAHRVNFCEEVIDIYNAYITEKPPTRKRDFNKYLTGFWDKATKEGDNIDTFMKDVDKWSSIEGRIAVVIDNPAIEVNNLAEEEEKRKPYAYIVYPDDLLDYAFDKGSTSDLSWCIIREYERDDSNFQTVEKTIKTRYRIWTKTHYYLWEEQKESSGVNKDKIKFVDITPTTISQTTGLPMNQHDLGMVPVVLVDYIDKRSKYNGKSLIESIAYTDKAIFNYFSLIDQILHDQTFSTLVVGHNSIMNKDYVPTVSNNDDKSIFSQAALQLMVALGTKRIVTIDGNSGIPPTYISPDPAQGSLILTVIDRMTEYIIRNAYLSSELSRDTSNLSGKAKSYEFKKLNAFLKSRGIYLGHIEKKISEIVMGWYNQTEKVPEDIVKYQEDYDVKSLMDDIEEAIELESLALGDTFIESIKKNLVEKKYPKADKDFMEKVMAEIKVRRPENTFNSRTGKRMGEIQKTIEMAVA